MCTCVVALAGVVGITPLGTVSLLATRPIAVTVHLRLALTPRLPGFIVYHPRRGWQLFLTISIS